MTAKEMIKVYEASKKYSSFRSPLAQYKVQDFLCYWRTLFCVSDLIAARGYIAMRRGKSYYTRFRVLDRSGKVVFS